MPTSTILTTKRKQDNNEMLLESSASSSLQGLMMVCTSQNERGSRRRSEKGDMVPSPCQSSTLDSHDDSCCYRNSEGTNCSSPSIFTDDSSCNDHTETSLNNDTCNTHRNEKSRGVSLSNLLQELHVKEQSYGYTSLEVASTYNAIGLFHCRLYKDYNGALHYHTKALQIINTLHQQQQLQDALAHDRSEVASDCFKSATIITARKVGSDTRIIPLLVTTYMDIGTCYELQQNFNMAIQYYEKTDRTIIRLEQQSLDSCSSNIKTIVPKHIIFACRRAIARVKRL